MSGLSDLFVSVGGGTSGLALAGFLATRLGPSKDERRQRELADSAARNDRTDAANRLIQDRADELTRQAIERLQIYNRELRAEVDRMRERYERQHDEDEAQRDKDDLKHTEARRRIFELEQHVKELTRDLAVQKEATSAAEQIARRLSRTPTYRTRQEDR